MIEPRLRGRTSVAHITVVGAVTVALSAATTTAAFAEPGPFATPSAPSRPVGTASAPAHALVDPSTSKSGAGAGSTSPTDPSTPPTPSTPSAAPSAPAGKFRAADKGAVANSYIVVLKNAKATQTQVRESANNLTRTHHGKVDTVYSKALRGFATTMTEADAKRLAADPNVAYVEQNHMVRKAETQITTIPYYDQANLWSLDRIDQPFLPLDHRYTYPSDAQGVTVYVLDTGVENVHSEFGWNGGFKHGWSATWTSEQTAACGAGANGKDDNGHGTFVAALITGYNFGVAKLAPIEPVKVLDCNGEGTVAQVVEGIEHVTATAVKPAVANMSLSGTASTAIDDAVNASIASGITYVVAAGNDGTDACTRSPARVPNAITVGATDVTDFRASFSNYGSCLDIFAPGVNVESAYHHLPSGEFSYAGYTYASGTSMASPLAAGAAALLLQAHPSWTPAQVRTAVVGAGITGTVHAAGAGSTTKLLRIGEPAAPTTFGLRSHANNLIVTAEAGGTQPLIASRYTVGGWEGLTVVDAGDGTHVGLRSSANNRYVTAEAGGTQPLIANRTSIGAWEKFVLVRNDNGSVSLRAAVNGRYVTADAGGTRPLIANRTSIGAWEQFDLAGPAATVFLQAMANGAVVTAENGGSSPLIANRGAVGGWEEFDVVDAGGYAGLLAHANSRFVTAESGGARPLIANRTGVGGWERFTLVNNDDGTLSFLANANGRFVVAESGGARPLIANRAGVGGTWEEFLLRTTDELS